MHQQTAGTTPASVTELFRCAVQEAVNGFDEVRNTLTTALRRGQATGQVPATIDPEHAARITIALIHGILLQWAAFNLTDADALAAEVRTLVAARSTPTSNS